MLIISTVQLRGLGRGGEPHPGGAVAERRGVREPRGARRRAALGAGAGGPGP